MGIRQSITEQIRIVHLHAGATQAAITDARNLLHEYGRFVISQPGATYFCFESLEQEAAELPLSYLDRNGGALIAYAHDTPAGFIAWRDMPEDVAANAWEMKRLWVQTTARGLGLGRILTIAVLDRARAAGKAAIFLDTVPATMNSAYRLYLELGFKPCAPFNDNKMDGITHLSLSL